MTLAAGVAPTQDRPTVLTVGQGGHATPQEARDAVRALKRRPGGLEGPVTVRLRPGTYALAEPLVLTPEDSGTEKAPITWEAAGPGVVLSGGRAVGGWKEEDVRGRKLWVAEVPEVKAGRWYFHQLWVDGRRRPRARHPNDGFLTVEAVPDVKPDTPRTPGQNRFEFRPGDVKQWDNLDDVDLVVLHLWVGVRMPVASVDLERNLVTSTARSRRKLVEGRAMARYRVENALELLDEPGEWYLDRKSGRLYYWPMPGEKIDQVRAVAPALRQVLRLEGKPEAGKFIEHVTFRGLTFSHTEHWPARDDPADVQAAADVSSAVAGDGLRRCRFERCAVEHTGNHGLHLAGGCQHNEVRRCALRDLGAGGVRIGEMQVRAEKDRQTLDNVVADCHIHDGGHVYHQAVGVWVGQSGDNRIEHNHIHDFYYTGISVGWTWGYGPSVAARNVVEGNHVHDLGKGWLSDLGGVYTLGARPGTVVRGNLFHDVAAHAYGGWGVYFDEGTTGVEAVNNVVVRTTHGGFHQHYGKDNLVRNNVFALGKSAQLRRSRVEDHLSFTFERNVVFFTEGDLLDGRWDDDKVRLSHNLYWKPGGDVRFGTLTLAQWQAKGKDEGSVVADPLLEFPEGGGVNFRPGSPAARVGFEPFDLSKVGPRPEE
jgi:hypothetical protein